MGAVADRITIRVNQDEYDLIVRAAKATGVGVYTQAKRGAIQGAYLDLALVRARAEEERRSESAPSPRTSPAPGTTG